MKNFRTLTITAPQDKLVALLDSLKKLDKGVFIYKRNKSILDGNDKNFVRTLNFMRQVGVNTLSEFIAKKFTRRDLLQIRNFGAKSIDWMLEELKTKAGVEIE